MRDTLTLVLDSPESQATMRWLTELLTGDLGLRQTDISFVTVIDEAPKGANKRPTKKQLDDAAPTFRVKMQALGSSTVATLGPVAFRAVTGLTAKIEDARGYMLRRSERWKVKGRELQQVGVYKAVSKATGAKKGDPRMKLVPLDAEAPLPLSAHFVVPAYSPHMVERSGMKLMFALKTDLRHAVLLWNKRGAVPFVDEGVSYFTSLSQENASHDYSGDILAFDIETAGKDSTVVERISFSNGDITHTLPWCESTREWSQRQFDLALARGALLVAHNIMFDIPLLQAAGCVVPQHGRIYDTMLAGVNLQPDLPKGLGRMASLYLNLATPWKWKAIADADPERYSALDSYITARLALVQVGLLKALGWYDRFVDIIMQRVPILMAWAAEGIRVDTRELPLWAGRITRKLVRYERLWARTFPNVNPHSPPQLSRFLYHEWRLPTQRTKEDGITTDELACVNLREIVQVGIKDDAPWRSDPRCTPRVFDLLLAIRREAKELRTYAKVRADVRGYIYPKYLPESKDRETDDKKKRKGAAATGRLASRDPNLQNQSKQAKRLYITDRSDWCWVQWDHVSAEAYVVAYMSGDRALLAALRVGQFHQRNADKIGCEKRTAKNTFYGSCYGAGAAKISETIRREDHVFVSVDECRRVQAGLAALYPDAFGWLNAVGTVGVEQGFLANPFKRTRFFYGRTRDVPAMKDYLPQSTVADMLWDHLKPMYEMLRLYGGRLTTQTHDSLLGQVHRDKVKEVALAGKLIMERRFDNVVPGFFIPVEIEVGAPGASWAELSPLEIVA